MLELLEFGLAADSGLQPAMEVGGFLVPRPKPLHDSSRGKEQSDDEGTGESPEAGTWPASPDATSTGAAAQAVQRSLSDALGLEELLAYHPDSRWVGGSESIRLLEVPLGLFRGLGQRGTLVLGVPARWELWMLSLSQLEVVPVVRMWAYSNAGLLLHSHHVYPDQSICCFMPGDWKFGRDGVEDLVGFGACWIGKWLHEGFTDRWPGPQHYPEADRLRRNRPDEYCGCGEDKLYGDCHQSSDLSGSLFTWVREKQLAQHRYMNEVRARGWTETAPALFW